MVCGGCGHDNREGARFCEECGATLATERECPVCTTLNRATAKFCDACGAPLAAAAHAPRPTAQPVARDPRAYTPDHLAEKIRSASASAEGERKQVTVMFADVLGSMDLAESTDPEAWRTIMERFFAHLCDGVHRFEGTVVQFTGDGIMALFGAPIAHEDHAIRAAFAALHLQDELSAYATELRRDRGLSFSVRMGLNSGEVVVGAIGEDLRVDYTAIGHTVGLAQRMESLAEPGKAFLTEHTAALLDGYFELRDLGPFDVKGVREPVGVSELLGTGSARTRLDRSRARGYSRFVGRERELAVLDDALERALEGNGNVVALVGEPGVGKSRLCDEFVQRCRGRGIAVYAASGAAHARSVPFHAALEMLRGYFGISDQDPPQTARERIAGRLLLLDPAFADDLPLLFDFVGVPDPERPPPRMDPDARQRRLLENVTRLVVAHSAREPAVNLLEDLHWVDGASEVMVAALVEAVHGRRGLVVANHRPEYRADWLALPHVTKVLLVPLGAEAIEALLSDLVGDDPAVAELKDEVRQRTGGNPFFIEEVVQALAEDGTLEGGRGAYRLARPVASVTVPPTVHAVLAARIDRLEPADKALLQAAAVLGREFGERVLEHVAGEVIPSRPDLAAALRALVAAEFLYERALYPEAEYAFKHPLTQEVAYTSQLAERRRQVHAAVAAATIELYPELLDERAALLAHHWEAADEPLEAMRWNARAAVWAGVNDPVQANARWHKVVELAAGLPETAETMAVGVTARVWILQFGWRLGMEVTERDRVFADGRELAERMGDDGMAALLVGSYGGIIGIAGDMVTAAKLAAESMERARRAGPSFEMAVMPFVAYSDFIRGDYDRAMATLERAIALGEADPTVGARISVTSPFAFALMMHGIISVGLGEIAAGAAQLERALAVAHEHGDRETAGWIHMNSAFQAYWTGELGRAPEEVARGVELSDAIGSPFSRIWARFNLGTIQHLLGDLDSAEEEFARVRAMIGEHRTGVECEAWVLSRLAAVCCDRPDDTGALAVADEALAAAARVGVVNVLPQAHTVRARALRLAGMDGAGEAIEEALAQARRLRNLGDEGLALVERAEIERAGGDAAAEEASLRAALEIFERMGAAGHATTVTERLDALNVA